MRLLDPSLFIPHTLLCLEKPSDLVAVGMQMVVKSKCSPVFSYLYSLVQSLREGEFGVVQLAKHHFVALGAGDEVEVFRDVILGDLGPRVIIELLVLESLLRSVLVFSLDVSLLVDLMLSAFLYGLKIPAKLEHKNSPENTVDLRLAFIANYSAGESSGEIIKGLFAEKSFAHDRAIFLGQVVGLVVPEGLINRIAK